MKDYYAVLGVGPGASEEEIRGAFLRKAEQYHPDSPGGNPEKMVEVCEAVDVLADPGKRGLYDLHRANPQNAATQREWESAAAEASLRAQQFPKRKGDMQEWMNDIAADVQKTTGGRVLAGLVAGMLFGAGLGMGIGYYMELSVLVCAGIGAVAGGGAGAFGALSNG